MCEIFEGLMMSFILVLGADKVYLSDEQPSVDTTVTLRRILLGQPFSLEKYKSLANKTALLDAAIASGNGNAILIIILFITKTLKPALVQRLLMERVDAMNIYIHYLSTRLQVNDITDLLMLVYLNFFLFNKNIFLCLFLLIRQ